MIIGEWNIRGLEMNMTSVLKRFNYRHFSRAGEDEPGAQRKPMTLRLTVSQEIPSTQAELNGALPSASPAFLPGTTQKTNRSSKSLLCRNRPGLSPFPQPPPYLCMLLSSSHMTLSCASRDTSRPLLLWAPSPSATPSNWTN